MLLPLLQDETPSPAALRVVVRDFYRNTEECLNQSLQRLLPIDFDGRHRVLSNPNEWRGLDDVLCLPSIYCIRFKIIHYYVFMCAQRCVMNTQKVTGRMRDGWRLLHPRNMERVLISGLHCKDMMPQIFFEQNCLWRFKYS